MLSTTAEMMNSDHNWNRHQDAHHCYYYHRRNRGSFYINGDHDQLINLDLDHHGSRNPRTSPNNPIHNDDEQVLKIDRNKRHKEENQDQTQVTSTSPSSSPSCSPSPSSSSRVCIDCKASKTPLWRTGPAGPKTLCNACGIRFRKRRKMDVDFVKVDEKEKVLVVPQRNGFQEEVAEAALLLMAISTGVSGGLWGG